MSIDQRLRNGLQPSSSDPGPDTLLALRRVEQRVDRRARTTRVAVGAVLAAAVVLVVGVAVGIQRGNPSDADRLAADGTSTAVGQELLGTYVVDVADTGARRREGLVGRWVVTLAANGELELRPPPGYAGATAGTAYRLEDRQLRTDALVEPSCQAANDFVGTYTWSLTDDLLTFTAIDDTCAARRVLFTAQPWVRVR